MAKVKINSLPPGFSLENGKIVKAPVEAQYGLSMDDKRNFLKSMYSDGGRTGDQVGYALEKYPTNVSSQQMSDGGQKNVRYSLAAVPREEANLEAEGGESVLTDLNDDGNFGLYHIKGPRHSSGGVPMNLPEQSFIFSDTRAMKMRGSELAEFGIESKKAMTPAKISKRFDLNKYYGAIDDDFADEMQVRSAELMLNKNKKSLSKLAYAQELSKDFEDGVPLAAHPYLVSIGQDPIEFTAKVENISQKKAIEKTMASLSPQQQQQVMMLQQFLAQAGQMQGPQQGMQQGMPPMDQGMIPPMQQMPQEMQGMPPMPMGKYGKELTKYQQAGEVEPEYDILLGGTPEYLDYFDTDTDYTDRLYDSYLQELKVNGKGEYAKPLPKDQFLQYYREAQRRNYELYRFAEEYNKKYNLKPGDAGYKNIQDVSFDKGMRKGVEPVSKTFEQFINDYNTYYGGQDNFNALTVPTLDETYAFQTGYIGNLRRDLFDQYQKMLKGEDYDSELIADYFSTGLNDANADKTIFNPYWKEGDPEEYRIFKGVSPADFVYGNTTVGQRDRIRRRRMKLPPAPEPPQPCPNAAELEAECNAKENYKWIPYNEADGTGCTCMPLPAEPGEPKEPPSPEFWKQDLIKMNAIAQRKRDLFRPFQPEVGRANVDYVLEDPTRAIAAINEQANILNTANNAFSGPQVGSARNASAAGKTMKAVADATAGVQARNVATANAAEYQNANLDYRTDAERRAGAIKEYDGTVMALQNYMDEKNFDREQYADAYANALTNRANTYNLNLIQDYYTVDPFETAGMITQTGKRAFEPSQPVDRRAEVLNAIDELNRRKIQPTQGLLELMIPDLNQNPTTNIKAEYDRLNANQQSSGYPGNVTRSQRGREVRFIPPFYRGKTFF